MNVLLDTHLILWIFNGEGENQISANAQTILDDLSCKLFVSIASAWEVALKISIGKLKFPHGVRGFIQVLIENNIHILGIAPQYLQAVETLPFYHRDPFDRLLIATAQVENIPIISADEYFSLYDVSVIW
ncbi:MAG: type II toxin-antitoxin system VapC family toxin [Bacteroidales bacterium]|nr:type II toxin-antitoxin system VapC family toxin [Bacteroidales bacterium]